MIKKIIALVNEWAEKEKQNFLIKGNLVYSYDPSSDDGFQEVTNIEDEDPED